MERITALEEEIKAEKRKYGLTRKVRHIKSPEEEAEDPEKCEDGEHCAAQQIVEEEDLADS